MRENEVFVEKILLDSIGKIKEIEVVDETTNTKKCYTHSEYLKQQIKAENMQILPTSVIIKSEDFCADLIEVDYENNNKDFNCWIAEIHVENSAFNPRIIKIGLRAFTKNKKKELLDLGGTESTSNNAIVYFSYVQLITMCKNSKRIRAFFWENNISFNQADRILDFSGTCTQKGAVIIHSNEVVNKLKKWMTKATAIGVANNYTVSLVESRLQRINQTTGSSLLIPPVREIATYLFERSVHDGLIYIQSIKIPDTVREINCTFSACIKLRNIEFGEETISVNSWLFYRITNIEYIDFKNIFEIPLVKDITKLKKIKVRIDASMPFNFISDLSTLKEVEMRVGQ